MVINIEEDVTLVMTASIDPKGMPAAATLPDPKKREQDYVDALSYYLAEHPRIRCIVFAENSAWPLDRFRAVAAQYSAQVRVEFLSFSLNDFPRDLGKSYGEMLLLDHIFTQSRFVQKSTYTAKLTGRSIISNITQLIMSAPVPLDFYGDLRDHGLYELFGGKWCGRHADTRFFLVTKDFYNQNLRGKYLEMDESKLLFMENLLYRTVKKNLDGKQVVGRFKIEPDFRGIAGHWGKDYGGARERYKRRIRAIARRAVPWLWI